LSSNNQTRLEEGLYCCDKTVNTQMVIQQTLGRKGKNMSQNNSFGGAGVSSLSLAIGKTLHMLPFLFRSFNMNSFDKHENIFLKVKLKWRRVKKETVYSGKISLCLPHIAVQISNYWLYNIIHHNIHRMSFLKRYLHCLMPRVMPDLINYLVCM
jgi:hypothetical protein